MDADNTPQGSGGTNINAGGSDDNTEELVKRSTYVKAVDEVKSGKAKIREMAVELNEYKVERERLAEEKLLEEKNFTELFQQQKTQIETLTSQNEAHQKDKTDFVKMQSALNVLQSKGVSLEQKYCDLLPLDQIQVTQEGQIDAQSVADVVEGFQKEHPRLTISAKALLPNNSTGSQGDKISMDEWRKLSPADRKKTLKEGKVKHGHNF